MNDSAIPRRADAVETIETGDGLVIQRDDRIHTLNVTAREVFELCDGTSTVAEILSEMLSRYASDEQFEPSGIEDHVRSCIEELSSAGLITDG